MFLLENRNPKFRNTSPIFPRAQMAEKLPSCARTAHKMDLLTIHNSTWIQKSIDIDCMRSF